MAWYKAILDKFERHLIDKHGNSIDAWVLMEEYDLQEEYISYEKYGNAQLEYICCPFVGCKWTQKFTINYDLLILEEE